MQKYSILKVAAAWLIACAMFPACFGQDSNNSGEERTPLPRFGLAASVGSLGAGLQAATSLAQHTNLRFGVNYFSLGLSGTDSSSNLSYNARLRLGSAEVLLDQNLKGPFHVSAGALLYDAFQGSGSVRVAGGQSITLNHTSYYSAASDPVTGTASIGARKVAPEVLIGFGNLLPRGSRHFTANFDLGVAFQGSPSARLSLLGSTCNAPGAGCSPISSNPAVQANIIAQQGILNNDLKPFQFYPILRLSFGYKF